ncbi:MULTISPECIES: hypothetical protein [unclassified Microbacterium]|uniref:hypothetical protein n=1 Tax=unclassified Microbacterium TaxID=2609290 RepID=UPI000EAA36F0|nr:MULTISPECIES: hypothetical protein [unclassified Microbacterium]MBT2485622.1 hypothetical protein [Microbacterium sp. ISL-108]RKN69614.1 hypothetical protein D7252_12945 [Microbacterium sp. CGR2]
MSSRRSLTFAAAVLLAALALSSCAASGETPTTAPHASATPTPGSDPGASAETEGPITCETMISPGTVEALTDAGWTAKPKEFVVGDVELTEGLLCFWADYSVGSDHGQLYGWAEITAEQAEKAQEALAAGGWRREESPEGVYFTEDPQYAMGTDDEGYGMTYLFNDGWVKLADTKQSLILIDWGS